MTALTDDNQHKIKVSLQSYKTSILNELDESDSDNSELKLLSGKTGKRQALFLEQIEQGLRQQFQRELRLIQTTLARIETGNYGYCISCGNRIETNHLDTHPLTNHCLSCEKDVTRRINSPPRIYTQTIAAND